MTEEIDATTSSSASDVDITSDVAASETIPRARIQWPDGPSIKQSFSLPESIIYYIAKNPLSANGYLKLIQSCKYFFEVNPIIVVARIHGNTKICSKGFKACKINERKCCIDFDINKLSSKIWLTGELFLHQIPDPNYTSVLCSKLYRSEIDWLVLFDKTVFLDDFKILASTVASLSMANVKVINNDESIVSIDEILEYVPKLKNFLFCFNNDKLTSTIKSIAKLNDPEHLELLALFHVRETLTFENFSNFLEAYKGMIYIDFDDTVSEGYKNQLDALIDAIVESDISNRVISYEGQDEEKFEIMVHRMEQLLKLQSSE